MHSRINVALASDIEFELLVLSYALNLMKSMCEVRFTTTEAEDEAIMKSPDTPQRKRLAAQYRQMSKQIVHQNIQLCNILIRILARLKACKETTGKFDAK